MKRHTNIEINRFTNFLRQGAFVRRHGVWTLLFNDADQQSVATARSIKTDYITSNISKKHYTNQWDMTSVEFERVLDLALSGGQLDGEKIIIDWQPVDKVPFEKAFDLSQKAIAEGDLKKAVPIARQLGRMRFRFSHWQKLTVLKKVIECPTALYPYGEWDETSGFMGASPEVFFDLKGLELNTMALAGTSGKDVDPALFLNDPKERKEHQFVIDDIVWQLKEIGAVNVEPTRVVPFPMLNHLETKIQARLFKPMAYEELIKKLHPTPALGIYPRSSYFKNFSQYPLQADRGFFGAPWGFETSDWIFLLVAIRKWDWSGRDIQVYAGCGVVQESILEKEFAEIIKKIDSVKRLFF